MEFVAGGADQRGAADGTSFPGADAGLLPLPFGHYVEQPAQPQPRDGATDRSLERSGGPYFVSSLAAAAEERSSGQDGMERGGQDLNGGMRRRFWNAAGKGG